MSEVESYVNRFGRPEHDFAVRWTSQIDGSEQRTAGISETSSEHAEQLLARLSELLQSIDVPLIYGPGPEYRHRNPLTDEVVGPFAERRSCIESLVHAFGIRPKYVPRLVDELSARLHPEDEDRIPREVQAMTARIDPLGSRR